MTSVWSRQDIDKVAGFDARQYHEWLRLGFGDWENPQETWRAFAPLSDRFSLRDDPEPQLAAMFRIFSEREKQTFLRAIHILTCYSHRVR